MDSNQHHREMQTIAAVLNYITSFKTAIELWDLQADAQDFRLAAFWRYCGIGLSHGRKGHIFAGVHCLDI